MAAFNHVMVMVSLLLALALAQLLRGATEIVTNRKGYWVHGLWLLFFMLVTIQIWWAFWDFSSVSTWTYTIYMYVLLMPMGLFVLAHILVPPNISAVVDWRDHYYKVRRWLFLTSIAFVALAILGTWWIFGISLLHPYRAFQVSILALFVAGLVSKEHKIHAPLTIAVLLVFLAGQFVERFHLGALAR